MNINRETIRRKLENEAQGAVYYNMLTQLQRVFAEEAFKLKGTQEKAAKAMGISRPTFNRFLRGGVQSE